MDGVKGVGPGFPVEAELSEARAVPLFEGAGDVDVEAGGEVGAGVVDEALRVGGVGGCGDIEVGED